MSMKDPAYKEATMRNHIHHFLLYVMIAGVLAVASAAEPQGKEAAGTVQGRVLFEDGKTPKGVVNTDAVLYLVGDRLAPKEAVTKDGAVAATLDQRDTTFVPHVLPVMVGTRVEIRNSDAIMHNVHTRSVKNPPFNRGQMARRGIYRVVFEAPEIIPVVCDVHSQMSAYILALSNPFFTKAEKDGTYTISGVPFGKYELVGWHEKYGTVSTKVEIAAGNTAQVDVDFSKASAKLKAEK